MQLRDQAKRARDWKVVAGLAAVATIGISGLAIASPNDATPAPDAIDLQDKGAITEMTLPATLPPTDFTFDDDSDDTTGVESIDDSPDSVGSPDQTLEDSPDASPQDDSDDTASTVSPGADDSPDSVDDSPDPGDDSPDDSADDSADDSV